MHRCRLTRQVVLAAGLVLLGSVVCGEEPTGYTPVAPASALHAAVKSNVKTVRNWVDEKDYTSAAEATRGLALAVQLYSYQSGAPDWRKQIAALQETNSRLGDAVKRKSKPDCDKLLAECDRLLEDMAKGPPAGAPAARDFKTFGANKTWMLLMEGTYIDAKRADTKEELAQFAKAIAEESNALSLQHGEGQWRKQSIEVRDAALRAAKVAADSDLAAAKKSLKEIYQRCEACHQREKK
jgi:hypothetical protein